MDEEYEDVERPGKWGALERAARANKGRYPVQSFRGGVTGPTALAFSPDSRFIANGGRGGVTIHDLSTGSLSTDLSLEKLPDGERRDEDMTSIAFSPDGRRVFAGDCRGNLYCWDVATAGLEWDHYPGLTHDAACPWAKHISAAAVAQDGKVMASAGADGHVMIWEVATGALVADVAMAKAGRPWIPSPDTDPERVWYYPYLYAPRGPLWWFEVHSLAFSPDGRWLACGMDAGRGTLLDPLMAIDTRSWQPRIDFARFGPRARVNPWDPTRKEWWPTYGKIDVLDFSPDGHWLATSGAEGIRLYEMTRVKDVGDDLLWRGGDIVGYDFYTDTSDLEFPPLYHHARFVNSDTLAIVYGWGIIEGIDLRNKASGGKVAFAIDVRARDEKILCDKIIAASPNGRFIAVGRDTTFKVIDLQKRT